MGRGVAHDQCAAIILQRTREDLRCRSAEPAGENNQRSIVKHRGIVVVFFLEITFPIAHLDDGTILDEKAGQIYSLFQEAATVGAQIENNAIDVFGLEFLEQSGDISCRATPAMRAFRCEFHVTRSTEIDGTVK
jgi:hypothetical protein